MLPEHLHREMGIKRQAGPNDSNLRLTNSLIAENSHAGGTSPFHGFEIRYVGEPKILCPT